MIIEEVLQAERAWVNAHEKLDLATIERLMADEYVRIEPDGQLYD